MKKQMRKNISRILITAACMAAAMMMTPVMARAEEKTEEIEGNLYENFLNSSYDFEGMDAADQENELHAGFSIHGDLTPDGEKKGVPSYAVEGETPVSFSYKYDSSLVEAEEDQWHLIEDKGKKVNGILLDQSIQKGALILQISGDGERWVSVSKITNAFAENTEEPFYETTELELLNGCYYRAIAAYELSRQEEDSQILFMTKENYDSQRYAEVFEFYLYDKENYVGNSLDNVEKIELGKRIRTEDEGYTGEKDIDKDDPHYGWDLGEFFVSGFTGRNTIDGTQYILKNVGDTVTLGFYLDQDIDQLNGKDTLSISDDKKGYDKAFETSPTDFGRGTLIIKYTDPDGVTADPQIYTDYLEANLSPRANTAIRLCEEGDYEVALDYEIQNDNKVVFGQSILPEKSHYRIAFKFSVRNSNCMVYTFDNATGSELKNSNVTENGFYIDLANSQYLDVSVKKEVLEDGADGLTEDTRFNRKARDKEAYTEDGIYTITVKNKAAELESEKKIYVGTNKILKAYMVTGLSISEIQKKVAEGARIEDDGTIIESSGDKNSQKSEVTEEKASSGISIVKDEAQQSEENAQGNKFAKAFDFGIAAVIILAAVILIVVLTKVAKKKKKSTGNETETNEIVSNDL